MTLHHKWHTNAFQIAILFAFLFPPLIINSQCSINGDELVCEGSLGLYESATLFTGDTTFLWYTSGGGNIAGAYNLSTVSILWSQAGDWIVYCDVFKDDILVEMCNFNVHVDEISAFLTIEGGHELHNNDVAQKITYCIGEEILVGVTSLAGPIEFVTDLNK